MHAMKAFKSSVVSGASAIALTGRVDFWEIRHKSPEILHSWFTYLISTVIYTWYTMYIIIILDREGEKVRFDVCYVFLNLNIVYIRTFRLEKICRFSTFKRCYTYNLDLDYCQKFIHLVIIYVLVKIYNNKNHSQIAHVNIFKILVVKCKNNSHLLVFIVIQ